MKATVKHECQLMDFLESLYPDSPRTRIKKLLHNSSVIVNGGVVTLHSYRLKPGDIVETGTNKAEKTSAVLPFKVLYEDDQIIVVDKPAGYSTSSIDGSKNIFTFLTNALRDSSKGKTRAYVVHRLDKEVSGVLLFAKTSEAMDTIKNSWDETEKHYFAFVQGIPLKEADTIKSWLVEDGKQKVHSTARQENAKYAVTSYRTEKIIGDNALLDVTTETGRKNQIRVHLSDIGCPIIGDHKYGAADKYKRRVRLHACSLSFPHPLTGKQLTVKSPMPGGFLTLSEANEKYK